MAGPRNHLTSGIVTSLWGSYSRSGAAVPRAFIGGALHVLFIRRVVSAMPGRLCVETDSNVPLPRRSGLADTIGMNEAALGAGSRGRNLRVVAKRPIRAADVPCALTECGPDVVAP